MDCRDADNCICSWGDGSSQVWRHSPVAYSLLMQQPDKLWNGYSLEYAGVPSGERILGQTGWKARGRCLLRRSKTTMVPDVRRDRSTGQYYLPLPNTIRKKTTNPHALTAEELQVAPTTDPKRRRHEGTVEGGKRATPQRPQREVGAGWYCSMRDRGHAWRVPVARWPTEETGERVTSRYGTGEQRARARDGRTGQDVTSPDTRDTEHLSPRKWLWDRADVEREEETRLRTTPSIHERRVREEFRGRQASGYDKQ